jgi:transposase-like protein
VRSADLNHGRNDLREDTAAVADVVSCDLDADEHQERRQREGVERDLGIGYESAWLMLHKLRRAMVRPGRNGDKLTGDIEVDESYLGGPSPGGKRGRGAEGEVIVAIAVERKGEGVVKKSKRWKLGRARIEVPDVKAKTLLAFVERNCKLGSTIHTDGLQAYKELANLGSEYDSTNVSAGNDPAHVALPAVHRVASLLKRWLVGTHDCGWGAQHVEAYLDEFVFRFNRRQSNAPGLPFYRLLQDAVAMKKLNQDVIVLRPKPEGTRQGGRKRTRPRSASAITNIQRRGGRRRLRRRSPACGRPG